MIFYSNRNTSHLLYKRNWNYIVIDYSIINLFVSIGFIDVYFHLLFPETNSLPPHAIPYRFYISFFQNIPFRVN